MLDKKEISSFLRDVKASLRFHVAAFIVSSGFFAGEISIGHSRDARGSKERTGFPWIVRNSNTRESIDRPPNNLISYESDLSRM